MIQCKKSKNINKINNKLIYICYSYVAIKLNNYPDS